MKKMWKNSLMAFALAACFLGMTPGSMAAKADSNDYREESLKDIKNVIIMIGDGMGPNQVKAGEIYKGEPLHMQTMMQTTYSLTASASDDITDSAAGGTALSTGVRTNNGMVGISPSREELTTIMDVAIQQGKRTGVVTTDILSGATPMSFSAHSDSRESTDELLASAADSGVNLFVANKQDSLAKFTDQTGNVYTDLDNVDDISESQSDYVIGDYSIKASAPSQSAESTAVAFDRVVREALEYLSQDSDGFVLMAEGAKIDKCGHSNDFSGMIAELLAFDDAVKVAMDWADEREDTVVIVTADHETGGLSIADGATKENLNESYAWSSTGHTAANVYCKVYGVDVDFARYSTFDSADVLKNTDIFEMSKAFLLGRQAVEVKPTSKTIFYGKLAFDKENYFYGEKVIITATPNENYELSSLKVNNVEMISSVKNNVLEYTIDAKVVSVAVKFTKMAAVKYDVTYESLGDKGTYTLHPTSVKAGEKLIVKINPAEEYVVDKVTFGGVEMQKTAENTYEIVAQASGVVQVTFKAVEAPTGALTESPEKTLFGCASSLGAASFGMMALAGLSVILGKRKNG